MNNILYVLDLLDKIFILLAGIIFFSSWFYLGIYSDLTIISGYSMFTAMFFWFILVGLDQYFNIVDDDEDFYVDSE